ncbi:MAG TPA: PIN domain-containing protein, partial [Cyclobacteriaceae bacterium]|nr:PIN domain-containing protein [Cyclobacteriaceae bacterium]
TTKDIVTLQNFISDSWIFELDQPVKAMAAEIRRKHAIKLADAVIAATALVFDLKLLTRNIEDFNKIDKLEIINPWNQ